MKWPTLFLGIVLNAGVAQAADTVEQVMTESLEISFGPAGAIVRVVACIPACFDEQAKRVEIEPGAPLAGFGAETASWDMIRTRHEGGTTLDFESADGSRIRRWFIPDRGWLLELSTTRPETIALRSDARFTHNDADGFASLIARPRYLSLHEDELQIIEMDEAQDTSPAAFDWSGFRNRYWTVLLQSEQPGQAVFNTTGDGSAGMRYWAANDSPGRYRLYLGPVEPRALGHASSELDALMYAALWDPLRWICFGLYYLLELIHRLVPAWAWSIMLLSVCVTILMWPLSRIADRLQQDVQRTEARLAPKISIIKSESKGEEQAERVLALYRSEGVHPLYSLKSMAGIMVVIPVFIGAFDMLAENIWLSGQSFLWISDLARPDSVAALPFTMPFLGNQLNVLPFLMTALSAYASYLHHLDPLNPGSSSPHLKRLFLLAVAFLLLFYTFPAGMVLYWTTNNAVAVVKNLARRRTTPTKETGIHE